MRLGLATGTKVVLAAGRQEHVKRHVDLIAATEQLVANVEDLVVLIAGREGNATEAIRSALSSHPKAASVTRLLGHREDVPDLLCAADVLVIPSSFEGTAGVALEAMALDCPVVCTDLQGVTGILDHDRNALLVPAQSPDDLAEALRHVLDNDQLANELRRAGRSDFDHRFTIEASSRRMIEFYESTLAVRGRP